MASFYLEPTRNTPEIRFDNTSGVYFIRGKSFPENSKKFYLSLVEWVMSNDVLPNSMLELQFDYISSSSVIAVLEVIKRIESKNDSVTVKWIFESGDDDMQNVGINYQKLCKLNIELHEIE
ncbi:MAG: DUF1987 domain-containing protein [Flavobacteriales bacterium]|nr:DUF1987 domain-containing protein [Flavobacteriales bacterium]